MEAQAVNEFMQLYGALYHRLHTRWSKDEQRPSPEALAVMMHLEASGPLTINEAALHFNRAQSAMSEMIDRMQAAGWLGRIRDQRDRRRRLVWLTEAGLQVLQRSRQVLDPARLTAAWQQLSADEATQLRATLAKLVAAIPTQEVTNETM
ncbi:MAG: winged helix-turn-helix transcriptional regulator [Acidobacteria bacterium]|nr:winged helix-turn-helix transcriptional regulator [Acidobacteriota bacterium]